MFQRIALLCGALSVLSCSRVPDYATFPKIDTHVHIDTLEPDFVMLARHEGFRLMTLVTRSAAQEHIDREFAWARSQHEDFPETVSFRDNDSSFIMIDNPRFDPILEYVASQQKPVIGHFGEPRNCWLPVDSMTVPGDSSYFTNNPQYHMYLHPDYPSYADQINARDNMLAKHPDLIFVGAHLGSLEWNVSELAERLDRFPNMAVDMAARISHLQIQDRDTVREFIINYQDRLLYGTDAGVSESTDAFEWIAEKWHRDWLYLTTDTVLTSPEVRRPFVGLKLAVSVLRRIYYQNAEDWLGM